MYHKTIWDNLRHPEPGCDQEVTVSFPASWHKLAVQSDNWSPPASPTTHLSESPWALSPSSGHLVTCWAFWLRHKTSQKEHGQCALISFAPIYINISNIFVEIYWWHCEVSPLLSLLIGVGGPSLDFGFRVRSSRRYWFNAIIRNTDRWCLGLRGRPAENIQHVKHQRRVVLLTYIVSMIKTK